MSVRLLIPELMAERSYTSARQLARALSGRVGRSTVYRLVRRGGVVASIHADVVEALADLFSCDVPDLFARSPKDRE